jgi:predicted metallopeptidase
MRWEVSHRIHRRLRRIIGVLGFHYIDPTRLFCVRGYGSSSSAWARIWGLPALWQKVLGVPPAYVVEVIEPEFSELSREEQDRILIHELLHIPLTFSGAIRPHRTSTFRITRRTVERYYRRYKASRTGARSRVASTLADPPAVREDTRGRSGRLRGRAGGRSRDTGTGGTSSGEHV